MFLKGNYLIDERFMSSKFIRESILTKLKYAKY